MSTKTLALLAALFGVVAAIGAFLPWAYHSMHDPAGALTSEGTAPGTHSPFLGTWVLVLVALGTFAAAVTVDGRELTPLPPRRFLLLAAVLFTLGLALTLASLFRDIGAGDDEIAGYTLEAHKSWGLYLTLAATLSATLTSAAAAMRAGRPPADAAPADAADADAGTAPPHA